MRSQSYQWLLADVGNVGRFSVYEILNGGENMGIPKYKRIYKDEAAKGMGLLIGIPETLYCWTVSKSSMAYMEHYRGEWIAWRETYRLGKEESISHKSIAKGNTFGYVLQEFKKYIDYVSKFRE